MSNAPSNAAQQCRPASARTDGRNERTYADRLSPTADTSSSVTRTRTYGISPELTEHQRRRRGERTARTPENLAAIAELVSDGVSQRAIAAELGISRRVVERALQFDLDVTPPPPFVDEAAVLRAMTGDRTVTLNTPEKAEAIRRLSNHGRSAANVAGVLGLSKRTVERHRTSHRKAAA